MAKMHGAEFLEWKIRQVFRLLDIDSVGYLLKENFEHVADNVCAMSGTNDEQAKIIREEHMKWFRFCQPDTSVQKIDENMWVNMCKGLLVDPENHYRMTVATWGDLFDTLDLNHDGKISPDELEILYKSYNVDDHDFAMGAFDSIDADKDGFITRQELIDAACAYWSLYCSQFLRQDIRLFGGLPAKENDEIDCFRTEMSFGGEHQLIDPSLPRIIPRK